MKKGILGGNVDNPRAAPVAQLDRVSDFESCLVRHFKRLRDRNLRSFFASGAVVISLKAHSLFYHRFIFNLQYLIITLPILCESHVAHVDNGRYFESSDGYRHNVNALLQGLAKNGILVADSNNVLQNELKEHLRRLPTKYQQGLEIQFAELNKNKRRRIIKVGVDSGKQSPLAVMAALSTLYDVDAICVSDDPLQKAENTSSDMGNTILMRSYLDSDLEQLRRMYLSELPSLHQLSNAEVEDVFRRCIRYTKWLRIYDKQIGKGTNLHGFRRGIEFILDIWRKHGVFSNQKASIEIITLTHNFITSNTFNREIEEAENLNAINRVQNQLIMPLERKYREWDIILRDPREFHARYLEGQFLILGIDRGFDFFNRDGDGFAECPLNIRKGDASHLEKLRSLPDVPFC